MSSKTKRKMISAFFPTIGFLMGGGSVGSVLFAAYLIHACIVVARDLFGGDMLPWMCLSATDFLFIERSFATTSSAWSWLSGVVGVWLEPVRSQSWVMLRAASLTLAGSPPPLEMGAWILCIILSLTPNIRTLWSRLVLGWISFSEARRALPSPDDAAHQLVRFLCFFSFVALFLIRHATDDPKRLQSALTILTTTVLTCCGLRTAWIQWHSPNTPVHDHNHERIAIFYIAYCIVDTLFACGYYRQYFTFLEGWVHHLGTGAWAIHLVQKGKSALFCPAMMVETSTILLSLRRTFYDSTFIRWLYDEWFPTLFVVFRIILPVCFLTRIRSILADDSVVLPSFGVFTAINIYWLTRMRQKKNQKK